MPAPCFSKLSPYKNSYDPLSRLQVKGQMNTHFFFMFLVIVPQLLHKGCLSITALKSFCCFNNANEANQTGMQLRKSQAVFMLVKLAFLFFLLVKLPCFCFLGPFLPVFGSFSAGGITGGSWQPALRDILEQILIWQKTNDFFPGVGCHSSF